MDEKIEAKKEVKKISIAESHPHLLAEWDYERNGELLPTAVTHGSGKKVWWKCAKGHHWETAVYARTNKNNHGCQECYKALFRERKKNYRPPYEKSIAHLRPDLAREWHPTKNGEKEPSHYTTGSNKRFWWKCTTKGHEWEATAASRQKTNCPYCAGLRLTKEKSFGSLFPDLVREWHPKKNGKLTPYDVSAHKHAKAWFICSEGHEWRAFIFNRSKGKGCPYCSGHKPTPETSLQGVRPDLAKEWHPEKNKGKTPNDYKPQSNEKVWWVCSKGHEYQSVIGSRFIGRGCGVCDEKSKTSFPEQALFFYIKKYFPEAENRKKLSFLPTNSEADIYIESLNLAIEYDGYHHRNNKERDETKSRLMQENGIQLLRVREQSRATTLPELQDFGSVSIVHRYDDKDGLQMCIREAFDYFQNAFQLPFPHMRFDISKDRGEIIQQLDASVRNLEDLFPELAEEWHPTKNGELKANQVSPFSHAMVWWKCWKNEEHVWESKISNRSNGRTCPYCLNRKINHTNSLATLAPELARLWHPTKNGDLTPDKVALNYNKKVWWQCPKGHEWEETANSRVNKKKKDCSYCEGRILTTETAFGTVNKKIAAEWHPEKNGNLTPFDFLPNSNRKVWWRCVKGHEWETPIVSRHGGTGCPYCSGNKVTTETSLAAKRPDLLPLWDYQKNKGLVEPEEVTVGSNKKVWWKCSICRESFERAIKYQTNRKNFKCTEC